MSIRSFVFMTFYTFLATSFADSEIEEPTSCEVCKYFVTELQDRLDETGRSKEVLHTGHGLESKKKQITYHTSELRLIEAMDGICEKIMEYNIHKERKGSLRFAKGQSETFKTLHGLVEKGVKVDLGIPEELWDEPSAEVSLLKKQCELMLENYEETVEDWYFNHQDDSKLLDYFCKNTVLKPGQQECLAETWTGAETKYPKEDDEENKAKKKKKKKKKKGDADKKKNGTGKKTDKSVKKEQKKEEL